SSLLCLLSGIVLRIHVFHFPRTDTIKLNHRLLICIDEMCGARRHSHEAALAHFTGLGFIGSVTHAQARFSRNHGDDLRLRMTMRGNTIAPWHLYPHGEKPLFGWVAVKHHRFGSGWESRRTRAPLHFL